MAIISKLVALLGVDPREFNKKLKGAEKTLKRTANKLNAIGRDLTIGVSAPLAAIGAFAVKSFADFDSAMTKSVAIMGDVTDQLGNMEEAALQVARTTTFSAAQAAESFFFLASAGLNAEESIAALPKVAAFAQAGMFDLAQATDLLTDAQSALGLTTGNLEQDMINLTRVSDVLVKANTIANASVEQFSQSLTNQAAAAARNVGIEIEEVTAVLAAFADQGIKGQEAGTKFAIVIRDLTTKAAQNAEQFEKLGIAVFNAQGNLRPISKILEDLEGRLGSASVEMKKLTLLQLGFSDKSIGALQSLIGLSAKVAQYEKDLKSAGGITREVAEKQLRSFANQMKIVGNQITEVFIAIGKELVPIIQRELIPIIKGAIKTIGEWVENFSNLSKFTKTLTVGLVAFTAAVGPLLIATAAFVKIMIALKAILLSPVFVAIAAGAGIILGLTLLAKQFAVTESAAKAYAGEMVGASEAMQKAAKAGRTLEEQLRLENIQQARKNLLAINEQLIRVNATIADLEKKNSFGKAFRAATTVAQKLRDALFEADDALQALKREAADPEGFDFVGPLQTDAEIGFNKILDFFKTVKEEGKNTFEGVAAVGKMAFGSIAQTIDNVIVTTSEKFAQFFEDIKTKQVEFAESANQAWSSWLAVATEVTANIKLATLEFFQSFAAGLGNAVADIVVFGADAEEVFTNLMQNILAQIVSTLVTMVAEFLIASLARAVIGTAAHVLAVGQAVQLVYLATLASISAIPIIGPEIAPGLAAAAAAAAGPASQAAGGVGSGFAIAALDTGGLVMADGIAQIHAGERVLKPDEVKILPDLQPGGGPTTVIIELDGRVIAQQTLRRVGRELRMRGVGK